MSGAQRGWSCDMVQPGECPGSNCGTMGDDSSLGKGAILHLPAELAEHEAVQHVLAENRDLKEAIRHINHMLRECYREFLQIQTSHKEEKEFLIHKFQEAHIIVENLQLERAELKKQLKRAIQEPEQLKSQQTASQPSPPEKGNSGVQEEPDAVTLTQEEAIFAVQEEGLEIDLKVLQEAYQALQKEKLALQAEICMLQRAAKIAVPTAESEVKIKENGQPLLEQPLELESLQGSGDNRKNSGRDQAEQLSKRLKEAEDESASLRQQLAFAQEELARLQARDQESKQQLQTLTKQLEQAGDDNNSVKAQVTSLLGELLESQNRLEACTKEKRVLEERVHGTSERLLHLEREAEDRIRQHSVQVDKLRLEAQNLASALRVERQGASEEKRKLAQLQVAYHQLFQEYDAHIKASLESEKRSQGLDVQAAELFQQLQQAEEALVAKQEHIDKLKREAEEYKSIMETVPVLKAQADIYKTDFLAEREARENLHEQREALLQQLAQLQRDYEKLKTDSEGASRNLMEEMRNRHSEMRPPPPQPAFLMGATPFHAQHTAGHRQSIAEEQPDYFCPKCQYRAPDIDTLQIHVMDCIQ